MGDDGGCSDGGGDGGDSGVGSAICSGGGGDAASSSFMIYLLRKRRIIIRGLRRSSSIAMKPIYAQGTVIKGFGRGSKELGIPTGFLALHVINSKWSRNYFSANFPDEVVDGLPAEVGTGVYYGWAKVDKGPVRKMVMSIGW